MSNGPEKLVLGLVISRGDRVIKRLIPENETITIGQSPDCDIVLNHDTSMPHKHVLAVKRGESYSFFINEEMGGKISVGDSTISLRDLRVCGFLPQEKRGYVFQADKRKKGQVSVSDITIHFGYFTPSPTQVAGEPRLADAITSGGFLDPDQKIFAGFLAFSFVLAGLFYTMTLLIEPPTQAELLAQVYRQETVTVAEDIVADTGEGGEGDEDVVDFTDTTAAAGTGSGGTQDTGGGTADAASQGAALGSGAADFMLQAITSNIVAGAGGVAGITGGGSAGLFADGGTVSVGGGAGGAGGTGGDAAAGFGAGGTGTAGVVGTGGIGSGALPTTVSAAPVVVSPQVDRGASTATDEGVQAVSSFFSARGGQIRRIYQSYLGDNPTLQGRIVLNVTVNNGAISATIGSNTTGSAALANEIVSTVNSWSIFGVDGIVRVSIPFNLSPQS